ncbi:polysaccharide pyruvyl transferase family protein [Microbulbifer hainanensis]|uniref:polysaccharide pyruvyl transferase family protein n=1 Tax=Microbulbifer hainanensis TaxID=2735675 RepID=UPI00186878D2|nr:polysaccharide pyruvyl transferase family protein [Microbulbifer hainanensis]
MTRIALLGAAPDTGNLGVNALSRSVLFGISKRLPESEFWIFDNGRGVRRHQLDLEQQRFEYHLCGLSNSRRFYRRESLAHMRLSTLLPGLKNPGIEVIKRARAVLDISGGDSFTDLYGDKRFELICRPKQLVLQQQRPLILLPQTYGPFRSTRRRAIARDIVRCCHAAWARDRHSFELLADLLGGDIDRKRHKCGVDVAFLLPALRPAEDDSSALQTLLTERDTPWAGLNVSGLIYNNPHAATARYGFNADYRAAVQQLLQRILRKSDARVMLVPHVHAPEDHEESDLAASKHVLTKLTATERERVILLDHHYSESEIKWAIAQLDWFCGTRMHSTIAALSSAVPTATISYSDKARGVFASCDQEQQVFDPRALDTAELVDGVFESFCRRSALQQSLRQSLPAVMAQAREQMDQIAMSCIGD